MVAAAAGVATLLGPVVAATATVRPAHTAHVIVQGRSTTQATTAAVRRAGGSVTATLDLVNGVAADLPATHEAALRHDPAVRAVTDDETIRFASTVDSTGTGTNVATVKSVYRQEIGATALNATGQGVRVALVDTGVSDVPDLAGRIVDVADPNAAPAALGRTAHCVNFSGEDDCVDRYGHGTFLAGLIAGNGVSSGGLYQGVAQSADIVSVKIAGRNGAADVSKVLAAIQWVVSFKDTYGIKVLNLSLGTNSRAYYATDPLHFAVERAWRAGITVVVAAGNSGPAFGSIAKPADDPLVLTVGAVDDRETPALDDDRLPNFSARGLTHDGLAKPDVVAPGARLVSIRLPDSHIEEMAGPGQLAATFPAYRRGSGTSMATAVTSGAIALLLQRHPDWAPDRVKFALTSTAHKVAARDPRLVGAGLINVAGADYARGGFANANVQTFATGGASIESSRGDVHVGQCSGPNDCAKCDVDGGCPRIQDDDTAQGQMFDADQYTHQEWTDTSWYTSQWQYGVIGADPTDPYGNSWLGNSWLGNSWLGNSWLGSSWYGNSDTSDDYGKPGRGGAWLGAWS
jgi:serine protease AprX